MQWIALEDTTPITAQQASKSKTYVCPECNDPVRLRSGPHRQAHYYHVRGSISCTQHKKSEEHLRLQQHLTALMPEGEGRIERPFPQIHRIADVAWEKRKLIFEIQCSPISLLEVQQRCEDYRSMGWELIWILSDKRFNKRRLSAAEAYLRLQTCYFAQKTAPHFVYDQHEVIKGHRRLHKGTPMRINPTLAKQHAARDPLPFALPPTLQARWEHWKLHTDGDILSRLKLSQDLPLWIRPPAKNLEVVKKLSWIALFKKIYGQILDKLLHKF